MTHTALENFITVETVPAWTERDRKNRSERLLGPQNSTGRQQADESPWLCTGAAFHEEDGLATMCT